MPASYLRKRCPEADVAGTALALQVSCRLPLGQAALAADSQPTERARSSISPCVRGQVIHYPGASGVPRTCWPTAQHRRRVVQGTGDRYFTPAATAHAGPGGFLMRAILRT